LYGIGIGLPYKAVIENVWKYFNHSRNAVAFINVLAFAGSAPLFNMLCNSMIQKEFIDKLRTRNGNLNITLTLSDNAYTKNA
jgi:hypothetical protein